MSTSAAANALAKAAERLSLMKATRAPILALFENTMKQVIAELPFRQGDSMVMDVAEEVARKMGISNPEFKVRELQHKWKSVAFIHTTEAKMEPPAKKGMVVDPPVLTQTEFLVVTKSILIEGKYVEMDENGNKTGQEHLLCTERRPNPRGGDESSSGETSSLPKGGKDGKSGKGGKKKK